MKKPGMPGFFVPANSSAFRYNVHWMRAFSEKCYKSPFYESGV
jgi:hypothetical protein